jgi:hypothetical protein
VQDEHGFKRGVRTFEWDPPGSEHRSTQCEIGGVTVCIPCAYFGHIVIAHRSHPRLYMIYMINPRHSKMSKRGAKIEAKVGRIQRMKPYSLGGFRVETVQYFISGTVYRLMTPVVLPRVRDIKEHRQSNDGRTY